MSLKDFFIEIQPSLNKTFQVSTHKARLYQDKDLLWLIVVLTLLNKVSLREKENFLKNLFEHKQLLNFYKSIGLTEFGNTYPKKSFLNKYLNKKTDLIQKFSNEILLQKQKELNDAFIQYKNNENNQNLESKTSVLDTKYKHFALDGKQIINCSVQTVKKNGLISQKSICMM